MNTVKVKKDTIHRAFAVAKRYATLASKVPYNIYDDKARKRYFLLREKVHSATWHVLMSDDDRYIPHTLLQSVVIAAADNNKRVADVVNALEAIWLEIE